MWMIVFFFLFPHPLQVLCSFQAVFLVSSFPLILLHSNIAISGAKADALVLLPSLSSSSAFGIAHPSLAERPSSRVSLVWCFSRRVAPVCLF